ncbi:MAG TPA: hypothetical protein VMK65_00610 [Longimicrobiales bacterium]|nr:hypothetical protein [Longimicrobiales bacterium]
MMTCGFCAVQFEEDRGQPTCRSCPLAAVHDGCRAVRCPHCGYENPAMPPWLDRMKQWLT